MLYLFNNTSIVYAYICLYQVLFSKPKWKQEETQNINSLLRTSLTPATPSTPTEYFCLTFPHE